MSFTFVQRGVASNTNVVTLTGVTAGNLIVVVTRHEGAATTLTCSDGTTSLTAGNKVSHSNGDLHGQMFYLLSANGGNVTYTISYGAARTFKSIIAEEHSYSGGTISLDTQAAGAYGTGTAIASNNITTTGTDELVVGGGVTYTNAATPSAWLVNGGAPDQSYWTGVGNSTPIGIASKKFTSTFTGNVSASISGSDAWGALMMAFKITAGGGGFNASWARSANQIV